MGESSVAVQYLEGVRGELATVEMDLVQYAESYYFREVRSDTSVAAVLSCVVDLVAAGERSSAPEVRNAAMMLASASASCSRCCAENISVRWWRYGDSGRLRPGPVAD